MPVRRFLIVLHRYLALAAALFVLVAGLTGSVMAFEDEIDHLAHRNVWWVAPGAARLALADLGARVEAAFPNEPIEAYQASTAPDLSAQVVTGRRVVFLDPYTGKILGSKTGPDWVETALNGIHQLHIRLLVRSRSDPGKQVMTWSSVAMIVLLLSGLVLWWPLKRIRIRSSGSSRQWWFDFHNMIGVFSLVFLLILAASGVVIGFERQTVPLFFSVTGSSPVQPPDGKVTPPADGRARLGVDSAMAIARAALPGAEPFQIDVPKPDEAYHVRLRYPEDRTPGGRSQAMIDPYTGRVMFAQGSRTAPAGARVVIANRAIHTGDLLGVPSKMLMSLASLMAVVQLVSGVVMFIRRAGRSRAAA